MQVALARGGVSTPVREAWGDKPSKKEGIRDGQPAEAGNDSSVSQQQADAVEEQMVVEDAGVADDAGDRGRD